MTGAGALGALLERVQIATGPDRELDALLWCLENDREPIWRDGMLLARARVAPFDEAYIGCEWGGGFKDVGRFPDPTASLDAAVALVEQVLPGWKWVIHNPRSGLSYGASVADPSRGGIVAVAEKGVPSAPLALVAALLKALIALAPHPSR